MSLRLKILEEVAKRTKTTVADVSELLGVVPNAMSTQLSNLRDQGAIEVVATVPGSFGRKRSVYAITAVGREILANPRKRRFRAASLDPKPVLTPSERKRYELEHERHVQLQQLLGIPDALIHGELIETTSPAVRR